MVAVFMPGLNLTPVAWSPDHQSHADLPARIHEVSSSLVGGFRLRTMLDSTRRPGASPMMKTRHGVVTGVSDSTAMVGLSRRGESSARTAKGVASLSRYMPA